MSAVTWQLGMLLLGWHHGWECFSWTRRVGRAGMMISGDPPPSRLAGTSQPSLTVTLQA